MFRWKRATENVISSTTHVVKGLEEGIKYEFRVAAENRAGLGPPSEGSLAAKLEDAMGSSSLLIMCAAVKKVSRTAGDVSHKPGGRLPLLSTRPAVTAATLKSAAISFAAW